MKRVYIIILLLCTSFTYAQENKRWFFQADIEILFPNKDKTEYSLTDGGGPISEAIFGNLNRILLEDKVAYGFNYSFNYRFWGGLSVGAVTGLNHLPLPQASLTTVKLGGQLRYTFVEEYKAGLYLQLVSFLPLRSNIEADFGEVRLGITIPISQGEDYNFTLGLFTSYINYRLKKPLFYDEVPDIVSYRGIGVNLGIQF